MKNTHENIAMLSVAAIKTCLWLLLFLAGHVAAERVTYLHLDALGSPVAATNELGEVEWREMYEPYGERRLNDGDGANRTWFTGKQEDKTSGLSYFGARWYNPELGRFVSIDPVPFHEENVQSFNAYTYANNNPYTYVDPDGRIAKLAMLALDVADLVADVSAGNYLSAAVTVVTMLEPTGLGTIARRAAKGTKNVTNTTGKKYVTYTAKDLDNPGKIYAGRCSGSCDMTPQQILDKRKAGHHRNLGELQLDQVSDSYAAIRGREQQVIESLRKQGLATDQINGVGPNNKKKDIYMNAAKKAFGE